MPMIETQKREALVQRKEMTSLFFPSSRPVSSSPSFPIPRAFSESMTEESIENAQTIISKWDPKSSSNIQATSLFHHSRAEAKEYVQSVKNLRHAMHFLVSQSSSANSKLVLAQKLMQIAMKRLEKEFHQILSTNRDHLDPESSSGPSSGGSCDFEDENEGQNEDEAEEELQISSDETITKPEQVSAVAMSDLKLIADCMIICGYRRECVKIYKIIRKSVVDEGLYSLGIERFRSSHLHKMKTEALNRVITNWLSAIKIAVRRLFNGERRLCDHVFAASEATTEPCFLEIIKEGATNLFRFPEIIATGKQTPERIFQLMELYEAISDVWPDIDSIFSFESTSAIRLQALTSLHKLGESIRSILLDVEARIQKDSSKTPVAGGGIHPLTQSVMNYISSLADYCEVLSDIVADHPPSGSLELLESYLESPTSDNGTAPAVSAHLARLILVLLCKLDSKTHLYKDVSLSYLFLANNLQFVVDRVHTTKLRNLLGDDWVFSHAKKVVQYASTYESMAWTKVFSSLPANNATEIPPAAAKECFRKFNMSFEEAYKKQTSWIVPDRKLRDEIKVSIAKTLVPAYQEFYEAYLPMLSGENNLEVLVKFAPDDLGNYLSDLFHGTSISGSTSSSNSSAYLPGCLPR